MELLIKLFLFFNDLKENDEIATGIYTGTVSGVISGTLTAIIGIVITSIVNSIIQNRNETKKQNAIWYAVREEVTSNHFLALRWIEYLTDEDELIEKEGKMKLQPLRPFHINFFDVFKQQIPDRLKDNPHLLNELRLINQMFITLNTYNSGKEGHKINLNSYEDIKNFNKSMLKVLNEVVSKIDENHNEFIIYNETHIVELKKL